VPPPSEWMDYLPTFKEDKGDNPAQHLITFHQCMDQLDIHHEDVLMKMFMYSLKGDAREWYFSLPASSIFSLRYFHVAFNEHCKRYFYKELIFEHCCEEFHSDIQHINFSSSEDGRDYTNEDVDKKSFIHGTLSTSASQEEGFRDVVGHSIDDYMVVDALDFSPDEPVVSNIEEGYQTDYEEKIVSELAIELHNSNQNSDSCIRFFISGESINNKGGKAWGSWTNVSCSK
jgi:hypothetical protein